MPDRNIDELIANPAPAPPGGSTTYKTVYDGGNPSGGVVATGAWDSSVQAYWGLPVSEDTIDAGNILPDGSVQQGPYRAQHVTTVKAILAQLVGMNPQQRTLLQLKLEKTGLLKAGSYSIGSADDETIKAFGDLLKETARHSIETDENVSWQTYLSRRSQLADDGKDPDAPRTTTQRTITSLDPGQAHEALRGLIGRAPTQAEIDKFSAAYNAAAKKHPRVTTNTVDKDGNQSSVTTGGFDTEAVALQAAGENPEYASYQAVATFMPALEKAMQADAGLGSGQVG